MKHINAEFTVPKTNTIQKFKKVISPESLIPDENEKKINLENMSLDLQLHKKKLI